jgi:predicted DNA-binding protein (MmcQ/YjbR family)
MNVESFREYCLGKKGVTEEFPFDEETLVFKVSGKMFALCGLTRVPFQINLKCEPERALLLREDFEGKITGAYHMSKTHWNTVLPGSLPPGLNNDLIDHSYELVVKGLTKKQQQALNESSW